MQARLLFQLLDFESLEDIFQASLVMFDQKDLTIGTLGHFGQNVIILLVDDIVHELDFLIHLAEMYN